MTGTSTAHSLPSNDGAAPEPAVRLTTHSDILDLIVQNASLSDILAVITAMVERDITGSRASILLLDEDGLRLRAAAGPSLPAEYNAAIDGTAIGPNVGTCGTAAYEKRVVITSNIAVDPAWADWRALAVSAGIVACWSTPFLGLHDRVLGTFAVYFGEPCEPSGAELALLHDAGYLAAVAVQQDSVRRMLRDTSRTNPLTGLPNRLVLDEQLRAVEALSAETGQRFAVIKASVEGMGPINEALGPTVGDAVLRTVAARLSAVVTGSGIVTHVWGCDFVVLMGSLHNDDKARAVAERIGATLAEPFDIEGMTLTVNVMIGLATYGSEVLSGPRPLDEPLRAATVAQASAGGTHHIGVYDPTADPGAGVQLLGPALRRGLDGEELALAYQPIVALADDLVDHYEALLRWTSPQGAVPPDAFVPVAEHTGLVADLGRYALEHALTELARQRAAGRDIGISVNLSVRQLADHALPDLIADLIAKHAVPPVSVTMEVTEGVLLSSTARGWEALDRIREVGVRVSLDDFGTGFSQLSYLRRFRFDEIKLDRTLVHDMDTDVTAYAIIVGAVSFAQTAGLAVVAEGIEQRAQAERLRDIGCTHGQGYLFGAARSTASPE